MSAPFALADLKLAYDELLTFSEEPLVPWSAANHAVLESAWPSTETGFGGVEKYPSVPAKAGRLLYSIAKAHGLPDGNKRLAAAALLLFLHKNDLTLAVPEELLELLTIAAASSPADASDKTVDLLGRALAPYVTPL